MKDKDFLFNEVKGKRVASELQQWLPPAYEGLSHYDIWEREVTNFIIDMCECSNGDAQGIVEAQNWVMNQSWAKALSAKETAILIEKESRSK